MAKRKKKDPNFVPYVEVVIHNIYRKLYWDKFQDILNHLRQHDERLVTNYLTLKHPGSHIALTDFEGDKVMELALRVMPTFDLAASTNAINYMNFLSFVQAAREMRTVLHLTRVDTPEDSKVTRYGAGVYFVGDILTHISRSDIEATEDEQTLADGAEVRMFKVPAHLDKLKFVDDAEEYTFSCPSGYIGIIRTDYVPHYDLGGPLQNCYTINQRKAFSASSLNCILGGPTVSFGDISFRTSNEFDL